MLGLSVPMIMLLSLSHSSKSMKVRFFFLWIIMIILVLHSLVLVYCSMTPSASLHRHPALLSFRNLEELYPGPDPPKRFMALMPPFPPHLCPQSSLSSLA